MAAMIIQIVSFSLALWLGLYLLTRDPGKAQLRFAGLGLVGYALGLATGLLADLAGAPDWWLRLNRPFIILPSFFWTGAIVFLLPAEHPLRLRFGALTERWLPPLALLVYLAGAATDLLFHYDTGRWTPLGLGLLLLIALEFLILLALAVNESRQSEQPRAGWGAVATATLFFGLSVTLLLFPDLPLPRLWLTLGIGGDLILLSLAAAALDAFDEGEGLRLDMLRSFGSAALVALLFGSQMALAMVLTTGATPLFLGLLLATLATAILTQTFADPLQALLDRLVLARLPGLRRERAALRQTVTALPRRPAGVDPLALGEKEFARITRRALSHLGDLPRLAASPLTRLPQVEQRLNDRHDGQAPAGSTLERAAEVKALLTERIEQLKPRGQHAFGTSDEWRHYNALYFPYVRGLKPYSRRPQTDDLDEVSQEAYDWFQTVPERTLYNWQNAAAALIARDLRRS